MVASTIQLQIQLAPGVFLGSYGSLLDQDFLNAANIKVLVNCGVTGRFLQFLDKMLPAISSDVIVLNLDPSTSDSDETYKEFHARFNKILQNYLAFFYTYNDNARFFVNSNFQSADLSFVSPTMNGVPLRLLFNINRLLKLIRNVNPTVGFLFMSESFGHQYLSNGLLYSLSILYLMDSYNYNFDASCKYLKSLLQQPGGAFSTDVNLFNINHYDDVLLIDSLKKFYSENLKIKNSERSVMTTNFKLKRSLDSIESATLPAVKRVA